MPNPMLWGVLAGLLNFVPYLGPLTSVSVIALAALASFEAIGDALMPPAAFVVLALIEGQILAPILIGARFTLRPLVVVLATLVGGWAWGIGGTLVAVPVLMAVRIACDQVDAMRPLSRVLGPRAAPVPARSARAWRWVHP
jgi:predicted PurR-regulated permease PerM